MLQWQQGPCFPMRLGGQLVESLGEGAWGRALQLQAPCSSPGYLLTPRFFCLAAEAEMA
jgi:hypothetical protein